MVRLAPVILTAVVLVTATTCSGIMTPACTRAPFETLRDIAQRWDDTVVVASATPRVALSSQINQLQAIRRDVQNLALPACGREARTALVAYMDGVIEAFVAFLANERGTRLDSAYVISKRETFERAIDALERQVK